MVCCAQFHLLFYASRPLPNTFAAVFVNIAFAYWLQVDAPNGPHTDARTHDMFLKGSRTHARAFPIQTTPVLHFRRRR